MNELTKALDNLKTAVEFIETSVAIVLSPEWDNKSKLNAFNSIKKSIENLENRTQIFSEKYEKAKQNVGEKILLNTSEVND